MKMNKKGFTLIELLAVIVILAIIALIATPIIMNVINKAQAGADARSVEAYGKALESAFYQYQIDNPTIPAADMTTLKGNLTVLTGKYVNLSGNGEKVSCATAQIIEKAGEEVVDLTDCKVDGRGTFNYTSDVGATKE